jgi:pimeloyl-ACP methyl ester carboxylesterase
VEQHSVRVNGVEIVYFEQPGDGPAVLLAHATGFHARCWDQVVAALPGRHVYAIDFRGHGRSEKTPPPYPWTDFGEDLAALAEHIGLQDAIGVGHSKGGAAVVMAEGLRPGTFAKMLLVDPVIMEPPAYEAPSMKEGEHFAARRRNEWASVEEMYDRFKDRPPFSAWEPAVLHDYCEFGLLPNPGGEGLILACPPRVEAAVYQESSGSSPHEHVKSFQGFVRILRAKESDKATAGSDMSGSPTWPKLATAFANAEDVYLPEFSHFMPMEDPAFVAKHILELID